MQNFVHWGGRREEIDGEEERGGGEGRRSRDGGGILKTRNWRNDEFAEAERRERCTHSLTRRLCGGNYAKEETRKGQSWPPSVKTRGPHRHYVQQLRLLSLLSHGDATEG